MVTAIYVPTAYGTVSARTSGGDLADFTEVERGMSGDNGPGTVSTPTAVVDLRELELRVARERAELDAARRELLEAQLQDGGNGPQR